MVYPRTFRLTNNEYIELGLGININEYKVPYSGEIKHALTLFSFFILSKC